MSEGDESDGHSESVSVGGRRKRRQTGAPVVQDTGKRHYNTRRQAAKGKGVATSSMDTEKRTDEEVGDAAISPDNEIASTPTEEVVSQNVNPEDSSARVLSYKSVQTKTVMVDKVVRFMPSESNIDENSNAVMSMENGEMMSEDFHGTSEYNNKDEHNSPLREEDDDDDEDDYNPGEASVPRKLWKFFTS